MAYMIMLVSDAVNQLDAVLRAWETIHVDDIVFMDSTCFHRTGKLQPHIPMRFMFEKLDKGQQQCSVTLFGIVNDEKVVQQCIELAETIIGDLDTATNSMFAAWPLPIIKGFSKLNIERGEGRQ
jgi:hypothetical protein